MSAGNAMPPTKWLCGERSIDFAARPGVMGVLNVTPDSFSDGGRYTDVDAALRHALAMVEQGADIVDVGGESTRPGAEPVPAEEERSRVVPVIRALRSAWDGLISVDTRKASVARAALEAGADIVNDVSAMRHDAEMLQTVIAFGAGVVLMHMRGEPRTMQEQPAYRDVVTEVRDHLALRMEAAVAGGLDRGRICLDPGIGFGKTVEHNLDLLAGLPALGALGRPLLVGISRKSLLGALTGRSVEERGAAGLAAGVFAVLRGAHLLRVHDVKETCDAMAVVSMLERRAALWTT